MTTENTYQLLVDRADGLLTAEDVRRTEALIAADDDAAAEWAVINLTVRNIREAGIFQQVSAVRAGFEATAVEEKPVAKVRSISTAAKVLRIAAVLVIVLASATAIKYAMVSSSGVYDKYYETYEMNTVRSTATLEKMEALYREKNYAEVLRFSETITGKSNKELFLTGMSAMELKKYDQAEKEFKTILATSSLSGNQQFHDEAEYYLALTYLAEGRNDNALPIFRSISNDPQHAYHNRVRKMNLDLRILDWK